MRKIVEREVTLCDTCKEEDVITACMRCGKEDCFDCQKHGLELINGIYGYSKRYYLCPNCIEPMSKEPTELYLALKAIKDFSRKQEVIGRELKLEAEKLMSQIKSVESKLCHP